MLSLSHHEILGAGQPLLPNYCVFVAEDFVAGPAASSTADAATFHLVGTSAALTLSDADPFGVGVLVSNSTNPAGLVQNGEPVALAANRKVVFEARVNLADADGMSYFCGLAPTSANVFSGTLADYVGFFTTDGDLQVGVAKNGDAGIGQSTTGETVESTGVTLADNAWVVLRIEVDGLDAVRFFVDGVLTNTIKSNLPDDENLTSTIFTVGSGETVDTDYVFGVVSR